MAIEFTLTCDGCGATITLPRATDPREVRAHAQLNLGAYCGGGKDVCRECRQQQLEAEAKRRAEQGPFRTHSIGKRG